MIKLFIRIYQRLLFFISLFIKFRKPIIIKDENNLIEICKLKKLDSLLIVCGNKVSKLECFNEFISLLDNNCLQYKIYTGVSPEPLVEEIERGCEQAINIKARAVIGIGGGSSMDAAKLIAARVNNKKPLLKMKGLLKVNRQPLLMIAIPTTAGTGSECSIGAVIRNEQTHQKYIIADPKLVYNYVLFEPKYLMSLPPMIIAETGMDALTHAIEAYIGGSNTKDTKKAAITAIKLIFDNLEIAFKNKENYEQQKNLQKAAYLAGLAFTKAYVGYVHSISHSIGAFYHVSHGLTNAIVLPVVLEQYGKKANKKLAQISRKTSLCDNSLSIKDAAILLLEKIKSLNTNIGIPRGFSGMIKEEDIPKMLNHAKKEGLWLYPVPRIFADEDYLNVYNRINKD